MGWRELVLMLLVNCNDGSTEEFVEGTYSPASPPNAKSPPEPLIDAATQADASPDADANAADATIDAGTCVRDESRDVECEGYHADAGRTLAIRCPAGDAGNPALPPPAIGCNYTGWADGGTLTMCCK